MVKRVIVVEGVLGGRVIGLWILFVFEGSVAEIGEYLVQIELNDIFQNRYFFLNFPYLHDLVLFLCGQVILILLFPANKVRERVFDIMNESC